MNFKETIRKYWPLLPALAAFLILTQQLNFIQDDAYISYRFVANFLNGDGLVYNIGEQIEGFTNFGWVILMIQFGALGLDFIFWSQVLGCLFGMGIIVLTFVIARSILEDKLSTAIATLLVGANMSLAYWAPAGLETAAFGFFALYSLYCYLHRSHLLIWTLLMAVWIRPEGALIAILLLIIEFLDGKRLPKFSLSCVLTAFVLSLPFVGFKLGYYGSILPNPFFAKTGFDLEQVSNGFEYAGRFFKHYGFYGIGLLIPPLFMKKLSSKARAIWLFFGLYLSYIILVGGDVLKVHRFFLPLIGPSAILILLSMKLLIDKLPAQRRQLTVGLIAVPLVALTYLLPLDFVNNYNHREKLFTNKMGLLAKHMKASDNTNFSVALPTIGIFGYELIGHDIIDMVGLTDSTIARHPEDPIPGMATSWKEQNHNSVYLLTRQPDYVIFSTGTKPSAPAEKALLLYPQFLEAYRTVGWYFQSNPATDGSLKPAYKKMRPIVGELSPTYPIEFVDYYKAGLELVNQGDYKRAMEQFNLALKSTRQKPYLYVAHQMAKCNMLLQDHERAQSILNTVVKRDSLIYEAHLDLYTYAMLSGDSAKATIHEQWLQKLVPWYVARAKSNVATLIANNRSR